jgi:arginase
MAEAANLPLGLPEAAVIDAPDIDEQTRKLAAALPVRPVVLGGCCCAHLGAVEGLARRRERLALVWLDAHGDLNTPSSSPSGNLWGMPLRMLLDAGTVPVERCTLLGARSLDPSEQELIAERGLRTSVDAIDDVLADADAVYVALDLDVLSAGEAAVYLPEPGGLALSECESLVARIARTVPLAGIGLTGGVADAANVPVLERLCEAAGVSPGPTESAA